jgi:hypothetical protein
MDLRRRPVNVKIMFVGVFYLVYRTLEAINLSPLSRAPALRWVTTLLSSYTILALFSIFLYKRIVSFGTPLALLPDHRHCPAGNRNKAGAGFSA